MSTLLGNIVADFQTSLATKISVAGTTATLLSITDDDGVVLPNGRYILTIDGDSSQKEYFSCTLTSTSLTALKSISRQGVETSGAVRTHRVGAPVTLTDFAYIRWMSELINGTTGLNASAPLFYDGTPTLSSGTQLATVQYVLDTVVGGTVSFSSQIINGTAGETIDSGNICYFKTSDQRWYVSTSATSATFDGVSIGIATSGATVGNGVTIQVSGLSTVFSGLTAGSKYYLSTAGSVSITVTSVFIGWAYNTSTILMGNRYLDALGGTSGTPSSTNLFVTNDDTSTTSSASKIVRANGSGVVDAGFLNIFAGDPDQSQTTQDTTSTVGEANTTTKHNKLAQSFIAGTAVTKLRGVALYKSADSGSFSGTVSIAIQADTAGSPSGSNLGSTTITNGVWGLTPVGEFQVPFSTEISVTAGSTYWIVITTSTSDNTNHPNMGASTAGGYGSGGVKFNNTTDGWTSIATIDLYFKTFAGTISKTVQTDTTGLIPTEISRYGLIDLVTTAGSAVTATTTETTIYTKVLPAGFFKATTGLRHEMYFAFSLASTDFTTYKFKLNGTTISTLNSFQPDHTVSGFVGTFINHIKNNTISTQNYFAKLTASQDSTQASGGTINTAIYTYLRQVAGTSSIDTSGEVVITITAQHNTSSASDSTQNVTTLLEKIG